MLCCISCADSESSSTEKLRNAQCNEMDTKRREVSVFDEKSVICNAAVAAFARECCIIDCAINFNAVVAVVSWHVHGLHDERQGHVQTMSGR